MVIAPTGLPADSALQTTGLPSRIGVGRRRQNRLDLGGFMRLYGVDGLSGRYAPAAWRRCRKRYLALFCGSIVNDER